MLRKFFFMIFSLMVFVHLQRFRREATYDEHPVDRVSRTTVMEIEQKQMAIKTRQSHSGGTAVVGKKTSEG